MCKEFGSAMAVTAMKTYRPNQHHVLSARSMEGGAASSTSANGLSLTSPSVCVHIVAVLMPLMLLLLMLLLTGPRDLTAF